MSIRKPVQEYFQSRTKKAAKRSLHLAIVAMISCIAMPAFGLGEKKIVSFEGGQGVFSFADHHIAPSLIVDNKDWPDVLRANKQS